MGVSAVFSHVANLVRGARPLLEATPLSTVYASYIGLRVLGKATGLQEWLSQTKMGYDSPALTQDITAEEIEDAMIWMFALRFIEPGFAIDPASMTLLTMGGVAVYHDLVPFNDFRYADPNVKIAHTLFAVLVARLSVPATRRVVWPGVKMMGRGVNRVFWATAEQTRAATIRSLHLVVTNPLTTAGLAYKGWEFSPCLLSQMTIEDLSRSAYTRTEGPDVDDDREKADNSSPSPPPSTPPPIIRNWWLVESIAMIGAIRLIEPTTVVLNNPISTIFWGMGSVGVGGVIYDAANKQHSGFMRQMKHDAPGLAALFALGLAARVIGPMIFTHRLLTWVR